MTIVVQSGSRFFGFSRSDWWKMEDFLAVGGPSGRAGVARHLALEYDLTPTATERLLGQVEGRMRRERKP